MTLDRSEIMTTPPENLAAKYSYDELSSRLKDFAPDDFDSYLGNADETMFAGETIDDEMIGNCENVLREWFDDNGEDRPVDAEDLAIAYHLWAATCFAYGKEDE